MATTIQGGFDRLRSNLEITDLQYTTVSTRQRNVREAVERGLTVLDSFLAGSYARSTMIGPLKDADLDIVMVLHSAHYAENSPASLLAKVRDALKQTYPSTPSISPNGQAVTITFTDFKVDVVPAFHRQGGGYLIPNSNAGTWISTDPKVHATVLTASNSAHNGNLVPLVKMMRAGNRATNRGFIGFYLELMAINILTNVTISNFPSGMRYVFFHGQEKVKFKQLDPAGFDNQVNGLRTVPTVDDAVARFAAAYNTAVRAEQLGQGGQARQATDEWRKIFGDYFPSYG
jgi:Second Messenger Oligonucleotide or Dinucleotide Synthetase domain